MCRALCADVAVSLQPCCSRGSLDRPLANDAFARAPCENPHCLRRACGVQSGLVARLGQRLARRDRLVRLCDAPRQRRRPDMKGACPSTSHSRRVSSLSMHCAICERPCLHRTAPRNCMRLAAWRLPERDVFRRTGRMGVANRLYQVASIAAQRSRSVFQFLLKSCSAYRFANRQRFCLTSCPVKPSQVKG